MEPLVKLIPYGVLLIAIAALWAPLPTIGWMGLLAVLIATGLFSGELSWIAVLPVAILSAACWVSASNYPTTRNTAAAILAFATVVLVALGLGLHAFPGFSAYTIIEPTVIGESGSVYSASLTLDKMLAGTIIAGLCVPMIRHARDWIPMFRGFWTVALATWATVIVLSLLIGYVRPDPKWTVLFFPWILHNFVTCLAEEAFFRGFIQTRITTVLSSRQHRGAIAVAVAAVLFGLAHFSGGPAYVLLATIAGVGYGWAYHTTGRIEAAIFTHLGLNTLHFLFLTYPRS